MSLSLIVGLLVIGILLLLLEIFLPGGVSGTLGIVCICISVVSAFVRGEHLGYPNLGVGLLVAVLLGGPVALWAWLKYFPSSRFGRRIMLEEDAHDWRGYDESKYSLLGKHGVAHTSLRPSGMAVIDGERVDVVTQAEMLDKGTPIKVIEVEGNRIVVAELDPDEASASVASEAQG